MESDRGEGEVIIVIQLAGPVAVQEVIPIGVDMEGMIGPCDPGVVEANGALLGVFLVPIGAQTLVRSKEDVRVLEGLQQDLGNGGVGPVPALFR